MAKIDKLLEIVKLADASDLHLDAGSVPMIRAHGMLDKTRHRVLMSKDIEQLIYEILTDEQIRRYKKTGDLDFAYGIKGLGRFRINVYRTYKGIAATIRMISESIMDLKSLGLGEAAIKLAENKSGLILITGPTNSGKTTTLAAMVDHININFSKHIITLEDPIEYIHTNKNSLISQRQIGLHSETFVSGLRASLREDPDVVLVGEMRDIETISLAITAAEVGLLVMGTLHTNSAWATIDRILNVFPPEKQQQIRIMLADSLLGVISQQLLKRSDGNGRILAYELLLHTISISNQIREKKTHQIPTAIQTGGKLGMRLLDNHLKALIETGMISVDEALKYANEPGIIAEYSRAEKSEVVGV